MAEDGGREPNGVQDVLPQHRCRRGYHGGPRLHGVRVRLPVARRARRGHGGCREWGRPSETSLCRPRCCQSLREGARAGGLGDASHAPRPAARQPARARAHYPRHALHGGRTGPRRGGARRALAAMLVVLLSQVNLQLASPPQIGALPSVRATSAECRNASQQQNCGCQVVKSWLLSQGHGVASACRSGLARLEPLRPGCTGRALRGAAWAGLAPLAEAVKQIGPCRSEPAQSPRAAVGGFRDEASSVCSAKREGYSAALLRRAAPRGEGRRQPTRHASAQRRAATSRAPDSTMIPQPMASKPGMTLWEAAQQAPGGRGCIVWPLGHLQRRGPVETFR